MKKVLIFLIINLLLNNKVYALEKINKNYEDLGYKYISDEKNIFYDKNDYIYEYGPWRNYNNEQIENIEIKTVYKYKKLDSVKYIHIYDAGIGTDKFKISEIKIFNKNVEIDYKIECSHCNEETIKFLNDNNYDYEKQFVMDYKNGNLIIELDNVYEIENLKINLHLNDNTPYIKTFKVAFTNDLNLENFIAKKFIYEDFKSLNSKSFEYYVDEKWTISNNFNNEFESEEIIDNPIYQKEEEIKKYRTVNKKYHAYLIKEENNSVETRNNNLYNNNLHSSSNITLTKVVNNNMLNNNANSNNNLKNNKQEKLYKEIINIKEKEIKLSNHNTNKLILTLFIVVILNLLVTLLAIKR